MTVAESGRRAELVAAAREVLETEGPEAITIRRLGAALGIRGPSLYKHFPDKAAIENALTVVVLQEQADAVAASAPTFAAVADAYRRWAMAHPHAHWLINKRPLDRTKLPADLEARAAAPSSPPALATSIAPGRPGRQSSGWSISSSRHAFPKTQTSMRCTPLRRAPSPAIAEPREHAYRPPSNLNLDAPKRKSPVHCHRHVSGTRAPDRRR